MRRPRLKDALNALSALALIPATVYVILCAACWAMQESMIYPRIEANQGVPDGPSRDDVEQVWTPLDGASDGTKIEAWFILGDGRSAENPGPAAIFFHGNGALIDYSLDFADVYTRLGCSVLLPEYRGYGRSGGTPSQAGITHDMRRFRDWLDARPEVDKARVIYHGQSLGGGVAAALSESRPPAAIVLQSTFTSVSAMANGIGVPSFLVRHPYRTDETLPRLRVPTLIIHGAQDRIIPVAHGRRLHEIAAGSRYVEMEGGHNDLPRDWGAFRDLIAEFLRSNGLAR